MNESHARKAAVLKALAHPIRFCIVEGLMGGQRNVGAMVECTHIAQPTVSQHLSILKAAGIIECQRDGNQMLYSVCSPEARRVVESLR